MKTLSFSFLLIVLCFAVTRCGQKGQEHGGHEGHGDNIEQTDKNKVLYDQVMDVHNEVMPKMDEIYKIRESLKDKIATTPSMPEEKKKEIETVMVELEAASEGMMEWMHKFSPLPDSTGEEAARKYLEEEMVRVKKVKDDMLAAIEKGNALK